jgi:serine/threonine-protein kinase
MYPQVFGKYVLERELARGGMARVCLATLRGARGFEKKLVVKQIRDELALDDEFVRRFVEEAKTTVALSHPNIVPVYELGVEQGTYFLAMELVDGVSITELLRDGAERAPLTPEQGAYVGVEMCRALDYAHRRMQVVHRDITPRNVMVDDEGQVRLIDFGIAARVRASGEVFGSPGHMPPEQMEGGALLGPETDLFAVAALLLEAWSGRAPFRRKTLEDCEAAMRAPHPRPSDADARLLPIDDAIAAALALDPTKRTASADELGRALRKFLQGIDLGDVARSLGERARIARERLLEKPVAENPVAPSESGRALASSAASAGVDSTAADAPVTRTFAERDELKRLSEPAPAPSTRRLDEGESRTDQGESAPDDAPVETIATRPLETPVRRVARASPPAATKRMRPLTIAAGVLLVGGTVTLSLRRGETPTTTISAPASTSSAATSGASSATAFPEDPAPSVPTAVVATAAHVPTSARSLAPPLASKPATSIASAHVTLVGDPGTSVLVDGVTRGACPIKDLELAPGEHQLRFVFEPTHEVRDERITVATGERVAWRADFTGTSPTIRVER